MREKGCFSNLLQSCEPGRRRHRAELIHLIVVPLEQRRRGTCSEQRRLFQNGATNPDLNLITCLYDINVNGIFKSTSKQGVR